MLNKKLPLVSILIPNYNHSKYLEQCIESAVKQTYPNTEIIVLDNCSTDNSVEVARKYEKDGVRICRNQFNIMSFNYKVLVNLLMNGEYFVLLCADDYLLPEFIEKAVAIMEANPTIGYVHGERDFITEDNQLIELDPFYKCSFIAPGRKVMPIYMVTTVAHPAQGVIRKVAFDRVGGYDMEIDHMSADRSLWFYLSYEHDAAYIREKMCRIRIGTQTETVITQNNFQHPILCHLTLKDYVQFARNEEIPEVYEREQEALERLAREFAGYAGGMLYSGNKEYARIYLEYARIVSRNIDTNELYCEYRKMLESDRIDREFIEKQATTNYQHKRSYEPPQEYQAIVPEDMVKWLKQEYKY